MCGICGILGGDQAGEPLRHTATRMANAIRHRGPDDWGAWADPSLPVALGQRRLSIIDLSPAGHQPMTSASGRFTIVFNGEIYNYQQVRARIESEAGSVAWRGHSDTEVLLAAFDLWGVVEALPLLNGMFAFAVWDSAGQALYLARDRMGEKPLYYSWQQGTFLFASELKALRAHPAFQDDLDREAIDLYFRFNCIPAPHTVYRGARKLPPAAWIRVEPGKPPAAPVLYWSARQAVDKGISHRFAGSAEEAIAALDDLLRDAVQMRMISDVPLGSFLSGGIDSSLVTALMQAQSSRPVRTYSLGNHAQGFDEAPLAKAVAAHLGTDHTELYVTDQDARDVIPSLPHIYDEPFSDSSQIPTYLLARLTRQHVTVALSGDGGDELFGGYNRHTWVGRIWNAAGWAPASARRLAARALLSVSQQSWDRAFRVASHVLPRSMHYAIPGYKMHRMAAILALNSPEAIYRALTAHWTEHDGLVLGIAGTPPAANAQQWHGRHTIAEQMMYLDSVTYLPDDILVKVDRASMAVSLEGRIPLLDHRVYEFSWTLPLDLKLHAGKSKWILRQLLARYVPPALTERAKSGFGIPIGAWLRGPLRDWAESLLDPVRLAREGFLNPEPIRRRWAQHLSGQGSWEYHLWDVLMFQAWLESTRQTPDVQIE